MTIVYPRSNNEGVGYPRLLNQRYPIRIHLYPIKKPSEHYTKGFS